MGFNIGNIFRIIKNNKNEEKKKMKVFLIKFKIKDGITYGCDVTEKAAGDNSIIYVAAENIDKALEKFTTKIQGGYVILSIDYQYTVLF